MPVGHRGRTGRSGTKTGTDHSCVMYRVIVPCLLLVSVGVSGCAAGGSAMDGARQFGSGLGAAASAPLQDFNVRPEMIPPVLIQARLSPYEMNDEGRCDVIAAEVKQLNAALGPDMDEPSAPRRSMGDRAADMAADAALDAIRDTATDFIPGRSWIRRLSGAARHSDDVQSAIQAGRARRAFLKGIGMQRNCPPPAAPSWFRPEPA